MQVLYENNFSFLLYFYPLNSGRICAPLRVRPFRWIEYIMPKKRETVKPPFCKDFMLRVQMFHSVLALSSTGGYDPQLNN